MNENREFKHQSKNRRKQVKKLLNQIEGTVDVSNDYNYIRVIPERRYKDQQKKEIDLTEEIFSHTRNKSVETYNKLNTIYAKSPSQFNPDNEKVQEILRSDITLPVGYKPPKKTFYQLMKTIQAQNNGQLQSSNRVNDEGNYALFIVWIQFLPKTLLYVLNMLNSNYVIPGSKQEDTLIKDLKKMSTTQNAYGNYKKLGWKSTFIKYREKKEEMERMKQTIVEKVIAIQKQRDSEEKRLALRKQQQRLSVIIKTKNQLRIQSVNYSSTPYIFLINTKESKDFFIENCLQLMLREEERQRLENLKQLAIQEEDDYDSEYSSNFQSQELKIKTQEQDQNHELNIEQQLVDTNNGKKYNQNNNNIHNQRLVSSLIQQKSIYSLKPLEYQFYFQHYLLKACLKYFIPIISSSTINNNNFCQINYLMPALMQFKKIQILKFII